MPPRTKASTSSGSAARGVVEDGLRKEIADGTLAPGFRLVEADLAGRFGVSRNGARLALDALAAEGLVERIPNKGARVRKVSLDEAVEIMETRMVLDGLMSRKAAEGASDADRDALQQNLAAMEEKVAAGELLAYTDLIQVHHRLVQAAANQPIVASLIDRLQAQIGRHQFRLSLRPERARQSVRELRSVVEAIVAGDAEKAELMGREHFRATVEGLRAEADAAG